MARVSRNGRILDVVGAVFLLGGAALVARAWVGFREVQGFVPAPGDPPMAAVQFADRFWRLQKIGVVGIGIGLAVFVAAWWVARRAAERP